MQVIPGSQFNVQVPFRDSAADANNVLVETVRNPEGNDDWAVSLELRAGQISLHSGWILHGSPPNNSGRRRCGLAMRYLSGDVRAYYGLNQNSIVCRGVEPTGHWANHSRPDGELIPNRDGGSTHIAPSAGSGAGSGEARAPPHCRGTDRNVVSQHLGPAQYGSHSFEGMSRTPIG